MREQEQVPQDALRLFEEGQHYLGASPAQPAEAIRRWEEAAEICKRDEAPATRAILLNNIGMVCQDLSDLTQALSYFERALVISEQIAPHSSDTATRLNNIGSLYKTQSDLRQALAYYARALAIDEQIAPHSTATARDFNNIGSVYQDQGDLTQALAYYERALAIDEAIAPPSINTATFRNNTGYVYQAQGDLWQALAYYKGALEISEQIAPHSSDTAVFLNNIGSVYKAQGNLTHALAYLERALTIDETIAPHSTETARDLHNIGAVHRALGDLNQSLAYYKRALAIDETIAPHSSNTSSDLNSIGSAYREQGDLTQALAYLAHALAIDEAIAPRSNDTARDLNSIGQVYEAQGDLTQALVYYQRALAIDEKNAPRSTATSRDLNNIGFVCQGQGDLTQALAYYQRALVIDESIAQKSNETARDLNNIGSVHQAQGDFTQALEYLERALAINEAIAHQSTNTAGGLNNIGSVCQGQGDLIQALEYYQRALAIHEVIAPHSTGTANCLNNIGTAYHALGDFSPALDNFQRALAIDATIALRASGTARDLNNIGGVYQTQGDLTQALEYYQRALATHEVIAPHSSATATFLINIGRLYRVQGGLTQALTAFERSIDIAESLRARASGGQRGKADLFAQHIDKYESIIEVLAQLGQPERGFGYAERSRARGMTELLAERQVDATAQASPELLAEEARLKRQLAMNYTALLEKHGAEAGEHDDAELARLAAEQTDIDRALEALTARLRRECPEYAGLQYPEPLGLADVQQQVLGLNEVLLEYFVGETNSWLWAVRRDRFEFYPLNLTAADLDTQVRSEFRQRLDAIGEGLEAGDRQSEIATGRQLYAALVAPAETFLEGADRIIISPDGPLHYLPFEALVCADRDGADTSSSGEDHTLFNLHRFFGECYVISYSPSATVLQNLRDALARRVHPPVNEFIGLGDPDFEDDQIESDEPDSPRAYRLQNTRRYATRRGMRLDRLPASGTEVRAIFALFKGEEAGPESGATSYSVADGSQPTILNAAKARGYLWHEASERRARLESFDYRYVHFATHGLLDDENPLYSGIAFSSTAAKQDPDGDWLLQTHEIFGMKLNADLVTLSACQTGLGKLTKGEGLVGMTRAFMYAGTPAVVVSLWNVDDDATAVFMADFYGRLRTGEDRATALAETKRDMMKDTDNPRYRDPFYWAAFVLQGEV